MALPILPDCEALVSAYLRGHEDITALVGDRVYTRIPRTADWPLIRLWRVGGGPVYNSPLFLDKSLIQIDAFGGSTSQARTLGATAMAVLAKMPGAVPNITSVEFGAFASDEDDAFDPPKPRYRFDVSVSARI